MKIGVLADTHNKLPDSVCQHLKSVEEIWHLGDVCDPSTLDPLYALEKPFHLVRGNCDYNYDWPLTLNLTRENIRFHLVHIPPSSPPSNCDAVLHGHTHVPRHEISQGINWLNPGCVTRPNRGAPPSIAILEILPQEKDFNWTLIRI